MANTSQMRLPRPEINDVPAETEAQSFASGGSALLHALTTHIYAIVKEIHLILLLTLLDHFHSTTLRCCKQTWPVSKNHPRSFCLICPHLQAIKLRLKLKAE